MSTFTFTRPPVQGRQPVVVTMDLTHPDLRAKLHDPCDLSVLFAPLYVVPAAKQRVRSLIKAEDIAALLGASAWAHVPGSAYPLRLTHIV